MESVTAALQETMVVKSSRLRKLAADLRIIADETRLRILDFLANGEQCVCDITEALGLSQPLASYHLAVLREAGLMHVRRDARWIYYSINSARLQDIISSCQKVFDSERLSSHIVQGSREHCQ